MKKRIIPIFLLSSITIGINLPAQAQWDLNGTGTNANGIFPGANSAGVGNMAGINNGNTSQLYSTQPNAMVPNQIQSQYNQSGWINNTNPNSRTLSNPNAPYVNPIQGGGGALPVTSMNRMSPMQLGQLLPVNVKGTSLTGLPPTSLDSFVRNAGGHAEAIYGDEGTNSWPPLNGFGPGNTINAGIVGQRSKTITTGNGGNRLPTASGNGISKSP